MSPASARGQEPPAVPVDPALQPAWELLLTVRGREPRRDGAELATHAATRGVGVAVGPVRDGGAATYRHANRLVVVAPEYLGEDPRALAAVLAHELTHARQIPSEPEQWGYCLALELDAMISQNDAWAWLWPDGALPTGTVLERSLTAWVEVERAEGLSGLYQRVNDAPARRMACGAPS